MTCTRHCAKPGSCVHYIYPKRTPVSCSRALEVKPRSHCRGFQSRWRYGVDTGVHRDHTVATPASTTLNQDTPCWTGVHREVIPVVSNSFKQPGLTGTHRGAKQRRLSPGHLRSSSGINRISTVRLPGDTVPNRLIYQKKTHNTHCK